MTLLSRSFRCLPLAALIYLGLSPAGRAADLTPEAVSVLAGSCANCHGPDGRGSAAIPPLRGLPENRLLARLLAFHEGKVQDVTVMTRLMKGYDRPQIEALAKWFAAEDKQ